MKKIIIVLLVVIVIIALVAWLWFAFFSGYDFDKAQQVLEDADYSVDRASGEDLVAMGVFGGSLAQLAESFGEVMVAFSSGSSVTASAVPMATVAGGYDVNNVQLVIVVQVVKLSIVTDVVSLLTEGDPASLIVDVDVDALLALVDSYPVFNDVFVWLDTLSDVEISTLLDRMEISASGTAILIGTSGALSLLG